jgi:mannose-6-phosphate isomerase-like protein (cupin superfamily)
MEMVANLSSKTYLPDLRRFDRSARSKPHPDLGGNLSASRPFAAQVHQAGIPMAKFNQDIVQLTKDNTDFRRVVLTEKHSQVVLMSVEPGDDVGEEVHKVDQILVFVLGKGEAILEGRKSEVEANRMVVVPAGMKHNFVNTGRTPLKLYTVYSPPEEEEGLVHKTKADAEADEE